MSWQYPLEKRVTQSCMNDHTNQKCAKRLQGPAYDKVANMNYGTIKYCDIANGEGVRTSLFVSGCSHHCNNCFQPETWSFTFGEPFTPEVQDAILKSLEPAYVDGLSILGGEPMEPENQRILAPFLEQVKKAFPQKTIWTYTGDTYEDLVNPESPRHTDATDQMLNCIDILVDGPFIEDLKDITLRFRGSSNQRIIDLAKTRAQGRITLWEDSRAYSTHSFD